MRIQATSRPTLKSGTFTFATSTHLSPDGGGSIFLGRPDHGIEITAPHALAIVRAFTGAWDCQEISGRLAAPIEEVLHIATLAFNADLLDLSSAAILDHAQDISQQQLLTRIRRESALTTWRNQPTSNSDHGISTLSARSKWQVEFFAHSPLIYRIQRSLDASGIGRSCFADLTELKNNATTQEVDLAHFSFDELGRPIGPALSLISRSGRLFPEASDDISKQRSLVLTPPELAGMAMWQERPHLIYRILSLSQIELGPLVIPGVTPCWRCALLQRSEQDRLWGDFYQEGIASPELLKNLEKRLPYAVVDFLSGLIALEVLEFIDTGTSALTHGAISLAFTPRFSFARISYSQHPGCGCQWPQK